MFNAKTKNGSEIVFKNKELDITWRKYNPYKTGEALEKIIDKSEWSDYGDARQVLNIRKHNRFNNPPGKDWHHIVEQNHPETKHSVENLAIVDERINRSDFNKFFNQVIPGITNGLPLRDWLRNEDYRVAYTYGLNAVASVNKQLRLVKGERGNYQEID